MVTDPVVTQPETYRMVVSQQQYDAMKAAIRDGDMNAASRQLGAWATKDSVTSMSDVRNNLAITEEFKGTAQGQILYSVEFAVKPGVCVREGTVGSMWDSSISNLCLEVQIRLIS